MNNMKTLDELSSGQDDYKYNLIKEFTLGAITWEVELNSKRPNDKEAFGSSSFAESKVLIQSVNDGNLRTAEAMEQTLQHEVVHAILDTMGEYDLSNNEKFVQNFSVLLHQYNVTKK